MAISASFSEPRKRKLRKNRNDLFTIVIARLDENDFSNSDNLIHLKVGYVPSHIYESIPINSVVVDRTKWGQDEYSVFRSTDFEIQTQEQADEIISMLNEEYQRVK